VVLKGPGKSEYWGREETLRPLPRRGKNKHGGLTTESGQTLRLSKKKRVRRGSEQHEGVKSAVTEQSDRGKRVVQAITAGGGREEEEDCHGPDHSFWVQKRKD